MIYLLEDDRSIRELIEYEGLLMFLITFAIVKVLPDPVTPNKVCAGTPSSTPSVSWAIASGWSPVGWYSEINSKFIIACLV